MSDKPIMIKGLIAAIFALVMSITAQGRVFAAESHEAAQSFFLLSEGDLPGESGGAVCIKSKMTVSGGSRDISAVFSELTVAGGYSGRIYTLFSKVTFEDTYERPANLDSVFGLPALGRWTRAENGWLYDSVPPDWALMLTAKVLRLALIASLALLRRGFFRQGAAFATAQPIKTVRNGLLFYAAMLVAAALFTLSGIGAPFALLLAALIYALTLLGEVSVGLTLFNILCARLLPKRFTKNGLNMYAKSLLGVIIIEMVRVIPYACAALDWLILPALCLGAAMTAFYEGFVKKVFLPYEL